MGTPPLFHLPNAGDFASVDDMIAAFDVSGDQAVRSSVPDRLIHRLAQMALSDTELAAAHRDYVAGNPHEGAINKISNVLDSLSPKARHRVLRKLRSELREARLDNRRKQTESKHALDLLQRAQDAISDFADWLDAGFVLQSASGTKLHQLRESVGAGEVLDVTRPDVGLNPAHIQDWIELIDSSSVFVVEHNWGAAFSGAQDFDDGEVRLPAEVCAFEFRVSGRHVIVFVAEADGVQHMQFAVLSSHGSWAILPRRSNPVDPIVEPLGALTFSQIRAIAIALDAEVAETSIVRAPHKLNRARVARGNVPIFDYHVVSLARRRRVAALPVDRIDDVRARRRLHFRRGHWRHYEAHKTWIRWTLVGDPDLGFVDKHYRL